MGGLEVLPFGVLIFVIGTLLVVNAWAVIDAKLATTSAAREAARVYVESSSASTGRVAADRAARNVIQSYHRDPAKLDLPAPTPAGAFVRCQRITYAASYRIKSIHLPFGIGFGNDITITSRHSEIVDPLRDGLPVGNVCDY